MDVGLQPGACTYLDVGNPDLYRPYFLQFCSSTCHLLPPGAHTVQVPYVSWRRAGIRVHTVYTAEAYCSVFFTSLESSNVGSLSSCGDLSSAYVSKPTFLLTNKVCASLVILL